MIYQVAIDPTGLESWIFYDPNAESSTPGKMTKEEAEIRKAQLEERHNSPAYIIAVSDAGEFKEAWNNQLGYVNGNSVGIDEVVIILHGSVAGTKGMESGKLYFENGTAIWARNAYTQFSDTRGLHTWSEKNVGDIMVSDLTRKNIGELYFSACNTANPDVYNIAYAFMQNIDYSKITGWDGGTFFNFDTGELERGGGDDNYYYWTRYQFTYYRYVEKDWLGFPLRERVGKREFYN